MLYIYEIFPNSHTFSRWISKRSNRGENLTSNNMVTFNMFTDMDFFFSAGFFEWQIIFLRRVFWLKLRINCTYSTDHKISWKKGASQYYLQNCYPSVIRRTDSFCKILDNIKWNYNYQKSIQGVIVFSLPTSVIFLWTIYQVNSSVATNQNL